MQSDQIVDAMESPNPTKPNPTPVPIPSSKISKNNFKQTLPIPKPKSRFFKLNNPPPSQKASKFPNSDSDSDSDIEDETPVFEKVNPKNHCPKKVRFVIEFTAFVILTTFLVSTLTIHFLKTCSLWRFTLWKWALMLHIIFCGRLVADWLVWVVVFFIEYRFPVHEKTIYLVYSLRKSIRTCVWLLLVFLSWAVLFESHSIDGGHPVPRTVSRILFVVSVAATVWLLKIVLVKVLASYFHVATFFDRLKVSVFHQYILEALSGDPVGEKKRVECEVESKGGDQRRMETMRIDMERLRKLSRVRGTDFSMRRLMRHVTRNGLSSMSRIVDRTEDRFGESESEMRTERGAKDSAEVIFKNVLRSRNNFIEEELSRKSLTEKDLRKFLRDEEVHAILPLFEGATEVGRIKESTFRKWVVTVYQERKSLVHALNDTKTAVYQLHNMASAVVSVMILIVTLLLMGVASMKVLLVITTQLGMLGFWFQNTGSTVFDGIVFVFVMHPFDAGDRCVIDGVQMIVEEMNIWRTVLLRYDNEKIYYPNSELLTKPISNFNRSPHMGDSIEFSIDVSTPVETVVSTPVETVAHLRKSIQEYLESRPKHWYPKHSVLVKEIENVNKMKMALNVMHKMNHQNFPERNTRRSELVFELKKILEGLNIKYHLLPQEVYLTRDVATEGRTPPSTLLWTKL